MSNNFLDTAKQRMEQIQSSPEHQASCQRFSQECARLGAVATDLLMRKEELQAHCETNTVRKEYASGSTLHRGFYCPSPTYDIIVGNTKRGKLLKRLTPISKPSHEYGFDADGKLLYCKWFYKGKLTYTEYLVHEDYATYGLTFSNDDSLHLLTEEVWDNGKLSSYSHCILLPLGGAPRCCEITQEHYEYDAEELSCCDMHHYMQTPSVLPGLSDNMRAMIPREIYQHIGKYQFKRENGFLTSYTDQQGQKYQVLTQRKA